MVSTYHAKAISANGRLSLSSSAKSFTVAGRLRGRREAFVGPSAAEHASEVVRQQSLGSTQHQLQELSLRGAQAENGKTVGQATNQLDRREADMLITEIRVLDGPEMTSREVR